MSVLAAFLGSALGALVGTALVDWLFKRADRRWCDRTLAERRNRKRGEARPS
jgi:membrane protein YqaA with SNARE-associated domain